MGVLVKIPIPFGSCTNGQSEVQVNGNTVQKVLESLNAIHAGVIEKICDENGNPRPFVNLYLNERDIRLMEGLETKVHDGDRVSIIPAITGG